VIGIFGGTFDPVHYGHIKPALSVKQALNLSQIRFIPNRLPPHRAKPWLSVEQRLVLLKSALQEYPEAIVDERELQRKGPSYMVDTLASLKQDFSEEGLCLIIGMDVFFGLTSWYQWRSIFDFCHLVVTTRPGFDQGKMLDQNTEKLEAKDKDFLVRKITTDVSELTSQAAGRILLQSVPQLDISSTRIRQKCLNDEDVSDYMPAVVTQQLRGFINDGR
jgi:nicotinate-nucleotide adenylyltransferase